MVACSVGARNACGVDMMWRHLTPGSGRVKLPFTPAFGGSAPGVIGKGLVNGGRCEVGFSMSAPASESDKRTSPSLRLPRIT